MNTLKIPLLVFGLTLPLFASAQVSALEIADKQFELNNFDGAIRNYRDALESAADKDAIYLRLGDACSKLGKTKDAISWYEKTSSDAGAEAKIRLARAYMSAGKYMQAAEVLKKISAMSSDARHFLESCNFALAGQPPSIFEVSNADAINSAYDDYFPAFSANQSIVYLSCRTDMPRKNTKMPVGSNQLLQTSYSNGVLGKPEHFNSDLKNIYGEGPIAQYGSKVIITQNNFISGVRPMEMQGLELSFRKASINQNGRWKSSQSLPLGGAGYSNAFASISSDGTTMVFSSNRPGGMGGFDLYLCKKQGGEWGIPINLSEINSPGNEITPFISGKNLFFSSDYLKGLGGFDVFRAEQSSGTYKDVYHLGDQVNSCSDDYGFIFDEQRNFGLFNSNREGGKGGEDLYIARRSVTDFFLSIVDENTKPLADVKVDLSKCRITPGFSGKDGRFSFQVAGLSVCEAVISKPGYVTTSQTFTGNRGAEPVKAVITLKRAQVPYFGFVLDEDGLPMEGVMVKATNTLSQLKFEAATDAAGKYTLPLEAGNDYLIYFSKSRYINLNINKKSLSAEDLSLGSVRLRMTYVAVEPADKKIGTTAKETSQPRFTLQIASVSDPNADLTPFKTALKEVGEVFMTAGANGTYKIKVGKFATREEAVVAYEKAQKAGYKPMISTAIGGVSKDEKQPPIELLKPDETVYSNYVVKLCALSKPENFNGSKIQHLGKISSMTSGNMTVFLLNNFKDLEAAKNALQQVQQAGFPDAIVVEKKDGQLLKVNK